MTATFYLLVAATNVAAAMLTASTDQPVLAALNAGLACFIFGLFLRDRG